MLTVQLRQKGTITLPREVRRKYHLDEGDVFQVTDLGDGSLLLTPKVPPVAELGDKIARLLAEGGVTPDEIMRQLDEEREAFYQEHYVPAKPVPGQ